MAVIPDCKRNKNIFYNMTGGSSPHFPVRPHRSECCKASTQVCVARFYTVLFQNSTFITHT